MSSVQSSNVHWVFVGLGNPGSAYERTRHNVGFVAVDKLAEKFSASCTDKFSQSALMAEVRGRQGKLLFVKPQSFMNKSGEPVQEILNFYKVRTSQLVVLYDDCELECGRMKLQSGGASGGHNGIKSLEMCLSTKDFIRIRIGISRPPHPEMDLADWVLGSFNAEERVKIDSAVAKSVETCALIVEEGFVRAQNAANRN